MRPSLARPLVGALLLLLLAACHSSQVPKHLMEDPQVLRRGNGPEPDSLDPQLARTDSAAQILRDCYEGLISLDHEARPAPGVAASWDVSADGLLYTFHLRSDARWSNGDAVVAQDFIASWQRLINPSTGAPYAQALRPIVGVAEILAGQKPLEALGVDAPDGQTVRVHLVRPVAYFLGLLAHWSTYPTYHGQVPARVGGVISNGAYVPTAWVVGSEVTAQRNAYYWRPPAASFKTVRYVHIVDANDEYARFRGGGLDSTYTLPLQPITHLEATPEATVHRAPQWGLYYYGFNLDKAPFKDAKGLRQALAMTVDRERLVSSVTGLGEMPAYTWVPPGMASYEAQHFAWESLPPAERLARARALYSQAGYSVSQPLKIELNFPSGSTHERIALAVAAMWKEALGVDVILGGEEFKSLLQRITRGDTMMFRASWIADYNDPWTFAEVMSSGFGINLPKYSNAAYDTFLESANRSVSSPDRVAALQSAERQLLEDAPIIPLYYYVNKHLVSRHIRGWYDNGMNVTYTKDLEWQP